MDNVCRPSKSHGTVLQEGSYVHLLIKIIPWQQCKYNMFILERWNDSRNKKKCIFFEGFGLLESGMASKKNEVNIMMKNVVDVVFGGLTYWSLGYGLTFGTSQGSNGFTGAGSFFLDPGK